MQTHSPLFSCRKPLIDYSCLSYTFNLEAFSSYLWLTIWHMRARVTFIHPLACFHPPHPHSNPPPSTPLLWDGQQKPVPRTNLPAMIWLPKACPESPSPVSLSMLSLVKDKLHWYTQRIMTSLVAVWLASQPLKKNDTHHFRVIENNILLCVKWGLLRWSLCVIPHSA